MNDEIKVILNYLDMYKNMNEGLLNSKDKKLLLDYITNLQQENEKLKVKTKEQSLLLIDYQDIEQRYEDYKSRCEKAFEYIKHCPEYLWTNVNTKVLLNILQNGSDSL